MIQMNKLRLALIAASVVSGPALAGTINCDVTPRTSVIADGQTLQLAASCTGGTLSSISLLMNGNPVSSGIDLSSHADGEPVFFSTPVGLGANGAIFTVVGTPASQSDTFGNSTEAKVLVKSVGAASASVSGFASTTSPVDATCGTANNQTVQSLPTNGALCNSSNSKPALVVSGPTSYSWSCLSLTGGAEANCYATRGVTYTVTVSASANGSVSPSGAQPVTGGSTLNVTATPATNYNTSWGGTCGGTPSGNSYTTNAVNGNCTVTASFTQQQVTYTVTANAGTGGTISPSGSQTVNAGQTKQFTVSANTGFTVNNVSSTCGGSLVGSTFTTGAVNANCTVNASFTQQQTGGGGSDPGSGSWFPVAGSTTRLIADQSGDASKKISYVPGCLNGDYPPSSSSSGCAGQAQDETGFTLGSGNVLGIRYVSNSPLSNSVRYFTVSSGDGGNPGQIRAWLSTDPLATYDSTASSCRFNASPGLYIVTGPGYCALQPNTRYYLFLSTDNTGTGYRYQVTESLADFN